MSSYQDDEIIMVPVPKSRLQAVYVVLGSPAAPEEREEAVEVRGQGTWTASKVAKLEAGLDIAAIRALLTRLAEQAPEWLTFREAVEAAGIESNSLRAQLGSLSKVSKRLFLKTIWPMQVRYAEGGEAIYSMDPKIAEWWLEAVGEKS